MKSKNKISELRESKIFVRILVVFMLLFLNFYYVRAQPPDQFAVEFTVSIHKKKTGQLIENLTAEDFTVTENGRKVKIVSVKKEIKPLSIVVIPTLGEGKTCGRGWFVFPGFSLPPNKMDDFSKLLEQNLNNDDELAIITTDFSATQIRGFDSGKSIVDDFREFTKLSNKKQETITSDVVTYTEFGAETTGTSSYEGVHTNFIKTALFKTFDYLKRKKTANNRSVILLLRTVYNSADLNVADRENIRRLTSEQEVIINWFGDNTETVFMKMFPESNFYRTMPRFSGGIKEPCSILLEKKRDDLSVAFANMFNQMRSRYRIKYLSDSRSSANEKRNIKINLNRKGKRKATGNFVISAPETARVSNT